MPCRIVQDNRPRLKAAFSAKMGTALDKSAESIAENARQNAPVKSGELHASITVTTTADGKRQIGSDKDYASLVEMGTTETPAHPFMSPAFEQGKHELVTDLKKLEL